MKTSDLNAAIASGQFKVTRLPSVAPRRRDLILTRVAAGKSFAQPTYRSLRESARAVRGSEQMGKSATRSASRRV